MVFYSTMPRDSLPFIHVQEVQSGTNLEVGTFYEVGTNSKVEFVVQWHVYQGRVWEVCTQFEMEIKHNSSMWKTKIAPSDGDLIRDEDPRWIFNTTVQVDNGNMEGGR